MRRTALDANTFQNNAVGAAMRTSDADPLPRSVRLPVGRPRADPEVLQEGRPGRSCSTSAASRTIAKALRNSAERLLSGAGNAERAISRKLVNASRPADHDLRSVHRDVRRQWQIPTPRQPFPGNIIPANRIHPVAKAVTSYMPRRTVQRRRVSRYCEPKPVHPGVLREGQVLQPDPEVRHELWRQAPRILPSRLERPHRRPRRQRYRQQARHGRPAALPAHQRRVCGRLDLHVHADHGLQRSRLVQPVHRERLRTRQRRLRPDQAWAFRNP